MRNTTFRVSILARGVSLALYSAALWAALFSFSFAESISSFTATAVITENNEVAVSETIKYDFGKQQRHGIFREIRSTHPQAASSWFRERYVDIRPVAVTRNGQRELFVNEANDGVFLRIGDPDAYVSGVQEYKIIYVMEGALSTMENGQTELYWNVTGDEWSVPIRDIEVTIWGNEGVTLTEQSACYVGVQGESTPCATNEHTPIQGDILARFRHGVLTPGQQLTVAQEIVPAQPVVARERVDWTWVLVLCLLLWFSLLFVFLWRWKQHHRTGQTIITQYEPFQDFRPMFTGVLFDGRLDPKDITAGIVYLAQQGFLSIKQTKETVFFFFPVHDYEITLLKPTSEAPTEFQRSLLKLLFFGIPEEAVSEQTSSWFRWKKVKTVKKLDEVTDHVNMPVGKTVKLSDIKGNQLKLRINTLLLKKLRKAVEKDLVDQGYIEQTINRTYKAGAIAVMVVVSIFGIQLVSVFSETVMLIGLFLVLNGVIIMFVVAERRTERGYQALDHLKGFKRFLSVTEKERYTFHNAPAKNPQQFMEYLPYAIAFGVETEWAEVFADMHIDSPSWYSSDIPHTSFQAVAFSRELSSFSQSLTSSTGTSGSSGGGSAGGGAGGGGGGSW